MTLENTQFSGEVKEVDLLVFGSGAAGLSAALYARINRLSVLLCEKASTLGGTTASSGGVLWIPGNDPAREAGIPDSTERAREYLKHELGADYRSDLADAFLESGPEAIRVLTSQTAVKMNWLPWPDYHPDQPGGGLSGRPLETQRFDGRRLRGEFERVRPPYPFLMLFGGMQVDKRKVDDFLNPFRSLSTFTRVVRTFARYGMDRLRYSRGTEIGAGNALVAALYYSLLERGAEIWTKAPLVKLVVQDARVDGAIVDHDGRRVLVRARRGVVLATGGFAHNQELRRELSADFPHEFSFASEENTGDGIQAARAIGAAIDKGLGSSGYWQPCSSLRQADGSRRGVMYGYLDRGRPGVIAVDRSGKRFVNEANSYHDVGIALHRAGAGTGNIFHFVCDRKFVWHHGLGMIRPFRWSLRRYIKSGYIAVADTIPELAKKIGVDPAGLADTVRKHNDYARVGHDPDFGKGSTAYNKQFGHPRASPNANLAPIDAPPYVALRIFPATLGTAVGLDCNANGQVLSGEGKVIPGLYACGNDMASVMRGNYPGPGITLGPAVTFAYRIAQHASGSNSIGVPTTAAPGDRIEPTAVQGAR